MNGDQQKACLGMLEHLARGSGKTGKQARRTRAWGKINSVSACFWLVGRGGTGIRERHPSLTQQDPTKSETQVFKKR